VFLQTLFASIRALGRPTQQRTEEEGAQISRRLRELSEVTKPAQTEMSTKIPSGNDPDNAVNTHRKKLEHRHVIGSSAHSWEGPSFPAEKPILAKVIRARPDKSNSPAPAFDYGSVLDSGSVLSR